MIFKCRRREFERFLATLVGGKGLDLVRDGGNVGGLLGVEGVSIGGN